MNYFACLLLFISPSIFFTINNLGVGDDVELLATVLLSLLLFIPLLIIAMLIYFLTTKKYSIAFLTFVSLFWYLQIVLKDAFAEQSNFISIAILFLSTTLFSYLLIRFNARRFIYVFISLSIMTMMFPKLNILFHKFDVIYTNNTDSTIKSYNIANKNNNFNVYYVITDGLTSTGMLAEKYGISTNALENELYAFGYSNYINAKSSYNITHLTLGSILSLDYQVTDHYDRYFDRGAFFPSMMAKEEKPVLIKRLNEIGYTFIHVGNTWAKCSANKEINCIYNVVSTPLKFKALSLYDFYSIQTFFTGAIVHDAFDKLFVDSILAYEDLKLQQAGLVNSNDSIRTISNALINKLVDQDSRKFYFVHHLNPHPPSLNSDCTASNDKSYLTWTFDGYKSSSECAIKRISEFMSILEKNDPNALVVIQGDHGPSIKYSFEADWNSLSNEQLDERFTIFNVVKFPKDCKKPSSENSGNVETIQMVMDCISGLNSVNSNSRHYAGFYEKHKDFGRVFEVKFKK